MQHKAVVTAFLRHNGKILILKRSGEVGTYRGRWAAVSGYLEESTPLLQAQREIREETGLAQDELVLVRAGRPLEIRDFGLGIHWTVHPFLFDIMDPARVRLDWENIQMRWIDPGAVGNLETVPKLAEALAACLDPSR